MTSERLKHEDAQTSAALASFEKTRVSRIIRDKELEWKLEDQHIQIISVNMWKMLRRIKND